MLLNTALLILLRLRVAVCVLYCCFIAPSVFAQWVEDDCEVLYVLEGEAAGDQFGWKSNYIGDLDGDDILDFVVTAPTNDAGGSNAGRMYVYSGVKGVELFRFTGPSAGGQLGIDAMRAGDVNNDDKLDVIVGAPRTGGIGRVYVISGASKGEGNVLHTLQGQAGGDQFGFRVNTAGDFNGDGRVDIMTSAITHDTAGSDSGRVYIYSGIDYSLICTIDGEDVGDWFGTSLATVGDLNKDGREDVVIGARNAGETNRGRAYVYSWDGDSCELLQTLDPSGSSQGFGHLFADGGRDVNNDGTPDIYVGDFPGNRAHVFSGADWSVLHVLNGNSEGGGFGLGEIVDDVNGDGHADLVLAAWQSNSGASGAGKAFVYSGKDGSILQTMTYTVAGANFGFDANGLGDVNGDGMTDFLVPAATEDNRRGRTFIMKGTTPSTTETCPDTITRIRGLGVSGDVTSLCNADDTYLVTRPDVFQPTNIPPVQIEIVATSPTESPGLLSFIFEGHVAVVNIMQRIRLFNYTTEIYDLVDSRLASTTDSVIEITIDGSSSDYIQIGTREMKALIQFVQVAFNIHPTWHTRIDQAVWGVWE